MNNRHTKDQYSFFNGGEKIQSEKIALMIGIYNLFKLIYQVLFLFFGKKISYRNPFSFRGYYDMRWIPRVLRFLDNYIRPQSEIFPYFLWLIYCFKSPLKSLVFKQIDYGQTDTYIFLYTFIFTSSSHTNLRRRYGTYSIQRT